MDIAVCLCGYRPVERLTHWGVSQLLSSSEPRFSETALKPIAGPDVFRSLAATLFLTNSKMDAILFLDDDVVFDPNDMVKLSKHIEGGKDIVGAAYATKGEKPQIATRFFDGQSVEFHDKAEPVKVMYLNGGCIMVSRKALEKMSKKLDFCNGKETQGFWPFFDGYTYKRKTGIFNSYVEYLTDDYAFCQRAAESGFYIWLDPSIRLGHIGSKIFRLEDILSSNGFEKVENIKLTKALAPQ